MQVREVICPSCSHRFMWMDVEEGPTIKKYRSVETGQTVDKVSHYCAGFFFAKYQNVQCLCGFFGTFLV